MAEVESSRLLNLLDREEGRAMELALVVPTYNESANIQPLLAALEPVLQGIEWEVVFVDDDSPDGTADLVRGLAVKNPRVRIVHRIGRKGLASACIEGILATAAPYVAVMDADLQHDESILPEMLRLLKSQDLDLVVGSRNVEGGSMGGFERKRVLLSRVGSYLARKVCRADLSDPMSGFFVLNRQFFDEEVRRLSGVGFKILFDIVASSSRPVRLKEVPYGFRSRQRGESKLDVNIGVEYLSLLVDKLIGGLLPTRFVLFSLVGGLGVGIHLGILALLHFWTTLPFAYAQGTATLVAMICNFLVNNVMTFRDRRLRGSHLVPGLLKYCAACSIGAVINVSFAQFLARSGVVWYLAGFGGLTISSVWNYWVNTILTWRDKTRLTRRPSTSS